MNAVANDIIKRFRRTISRYRMISPGDGVIIAVSGGPDSVCLLDILYNLKDDLGIFLVVAHFDHGLRPDEDEGETRFVRSLALKLDLPFETKKAGKSLLGKGSSLEERARDARYRFLEEVQQSRSCRKIAVGHNLNDQSETVLLRLLRGSGTSGLAGIPPYRDKKIIRPLIEISRKEIESYIHCRKLPFLSDPSNLSTRHMRNRIRLELLPLLKEYQPRIVALLGQTAEVLRMDDELLQKEVEGWVKGVVETGHDGELHIPLPPFLLLPKGLRNRVIRHVLKMVGGNLRRVHMRHIEAVNGLATGKNPQAGLDLPNGLTAKRVYDSLIFNAGKGYKPEAFLYHLTGPGTYHLEALNSTVSLQEMQNNGLADFASSPWVAFLDTHDITYPLVIRNLQPGDKFIPLGMRGHKKIKDFFIDLKIPSEARARVPILICEDTVIWVCGHRIDERFKVSSHTKQVLKVMFRTYPRFL